MPGLEWHVLNDVTALLTAHLEQSISFGKTLLITVSSGIGSRLYDHELERIPYDPRHGIQGEIGHLTCSFELEGSLLKRRCECGGWNHINAFSSGWGIAQTLSELPVLGDVFNRMVDRRAELWLQGTDSYRLAAFQRLLQGGNCTAVELLDAFVTPLTRTLCVALSLDPCIERIVITGGVAQALSPHYERALHRTFLREGLYQITERDPEYLARRMCFKVVDDFAGLLGAGIHAAAINQGGMYDGPYRSSRGASECRYARPPGS
jgi:2-epi-5-epi-valiolone 7-kinase